MHFRIQPIESASCRVVLFLLSGTVVLWSASISAENGEVGPRARAKLSVNNVRVLGAFERQSFRYRNSTQMYRSPHTFARRIAEYLTKEPMPADPPPTVSTKPLNLTQKYIVSLCHLTLTPTTLPTMHYYLPQTIFFFNQS